MEPETEVLEQDKPIYDVPWFEKGGRHGIDNRISDLIGFLPPSASDYSALDIGCAEGAMIEQLHHLFKSFHGIEKFSNLHDAANERLTSLQNCTVEMRDIEREPLTQAYDYIFFLGVLHYYRDEEPRSKILRNLMENTNKYLFVRTSYKQNREGRVPKDKEELILSKSTDLATIGKLCEELPFRWFFFDNRYRGEADFRLGDLVLLERIEKTSPARALTFLGQ